MHCATCERLALYCNVSVAMSSFLRVVAVTLFVFAGSLALYAMLRAMKGSMHAASPAVRSEFLSDDPVNTNKCFMRKAVWVLHRSSHRAAVLICGLRICP
jgi:hypothetical protein